MGGSKPGNNHRSCDESRPKAKFLLELVVQGFPKSKYQVPKDFHANAAPALLQGRKVSHVPKFIKIEIFQQPNENTCTNSSLSKRVPKKVQKTQTSGPAQTWKDFSTPLCYNN